MGVCYRDRTEEGTEEAQAELAAAVFDRDAALAATREVRGFGLFSIMMYGFFTLFRSKVDGQPARQSAQPPSPPNARLRGYTDCLGEESW